MINVPAKAKDRKVPLKKPVETPTKSLQKQAKSSVKVANEQTSPKKAKSIAKRKRVHSKQGKNIQKQEEEYEGVVRKKAKQTLQQKGKKSIPHVSVEVKSKDEAEEECDDTDEEKTQLNLNETEECEDEDGEDEKNIPKQEEDEEETVARMLVKLLSGRKSVPPAPFEIKPRVKSKDEAEEESEDDNEDEICQAEDSKSNESSVSKQKEKEKTCTEIPQIIITNLSSVASNASIKKYFQDCGEILNCYMKYDEETKKPFCLVSFQELNGAKFAVATKHGREFEGSTINVAIYRAPHVFTTEDTVTLSIHPNIHSNMYPGIKAKMSALFGNIAVFEVSSNRRTAFVQFTNKRSVINALYTQTFNVNGFAFKIGTYIPFDVNRVLLFGLTSELEEKDIERVMSSQCMVLSTTIVIDEVTGERKTYANVCLKDEKDVDKLIAMKTIKIKNVVLDILPVSQSKYYYNPVTKIYFRHPAGIFAENVESFPEVRLWKLFGSFGTIDKICLINNKRDAMVLFNDKVSAEKALKSDVTEINEMGIEIHAIDGVYAPKIYKSTSVYISNIPHYENIKEVVAKVEQLGGQIHRIIQVRDFLTNRFKNAIIIHFQNKQVAKTVLHAKIQLANNVVLSQETYDSAKHDVGIEKIILLENLGERTTEVDLLMSFETYGEIEKAVVLRKDTEPIGCGYVKFSTADIALKSLNASTIDINGMTVQIIEPTREIVEKFRGRLQFESKFKPHKFSKGSNLKNSSESTHAFTTFKKNRFRKS